jgi:biotin operon repressor
MKFDVRDTRNSNWLWMRRELVREHGDELGVYGIAVYTALASFADDSSTAYPSIQSVADMVDCSPNKVRDSIRALRDLGWIGYVQRQEESGRQTSHIFYLLGCPVEEDSVEGDPSRDEEGTPHDMKGDPSRDEDEVERKEVDNTTAGAREGKTPLDAYHEEFPDYRPNARQKEEVQARVDDLDVWREVLKWWRLNGYSAKSIGRMLDKYRQTDSPEDLYPRSGDGRSGSPPGGPTPIFDDPSRSTVVW